ncbi:MAG: ABC transporter ATP-binding protein, partial [Methylococcales bacterium]|nr:ABC transporter ATP-binding protein [Methylococcales bacterium]
MHNIERQIGESLKLHKGITGKEAKTRILELLELVGIRNAQSRLNAYPHELSGGQRQRIMIAMALANEPELLIADEPTTALDVTIQAQILELLNELKQRLDMALLLITHDLGIVRKMADHIHVMKDGEIVESASSRALFAAPEHPYTQRLLQAEPGQLPARSSEASVEIMRATNIRVRYPIKGGFFGRTLSYVNACDGVDVCVKAGRTVGVVGESGSGKTTLGLALLRLIRSEGEIHFKGEAIHHRKSSDLRELRHRMQIVIQDPFGSLSPRLSVLQIIEEGLKVHERSMSGTDREAVVRQVLDEVGMDDNCLHRFPHEFSGGQRQRIGVARSLATNPDFIVADEPRSALDVSIQAQVLNLLKDLQEELSLTMLFISHDLPVIRQVCDRVAVMRDG